MPKHHGGFWPFSPNTEKPSEPVQEEPEKEKEEGEGAGEGFFSGLFGKKNVPEETPALPIEETPQGPPLPKSVQAGGSKRRTKTRKHRTLKKKNRSHRRPARKQKK